MLCAGREPHHALGVITGLADGVGPKSPHVPHLRQDAHEVPLSPAVSPRQTPLSKKVTLSSKPQCPSINAQNDAH